MDFRYKRKYVAPNGMDGQGGRCKGKRGEDLVIKVPRGTVVRDSETNEVIKDMSDSEDYILCKGGRGGWGNQHFATPTRQVPRFAKAGLPGEEHEVILELKLLADVGLVGFPNVGKSTLLSVTSNAHPKIANYHFTTLYPNLGVIYVADGVSFVMADIPGIIEGAADGVGLGHDFLHPDKKHNTGRYETVGNDVPLQVRERAGEQKARKQPRFEGLERNIILQQQRNVHRRRDELRPHMAGRELCAAVAAAPPGEKIAQHGDEIPRREHMAAFVAVRAAAQHALAVHDAPGHAVQKAAHARAEQRRDKAAVRRKRR